MRDDRQQAVEVVRRTQYERILTLEDSYHHFGVLGRIDATVIEHLNRVLKNELTAINQYFLHAKILEDRGLHRIAKKEKHESIEEMEHADWLMELSYAFKTTWKRLP